MNRTQKFILEEQKIFSKQVKKLDSVMESLLHD